MNATAPSTQEATHWRVAYQGAPAANSERAGLTLLAERFIGWPFANFADVAAMLASGSCEFALLPVFNSTTGPIREAINVIREHDFVAVDTITLAIEHWLLGLQGASRHRIREVLAHPQVIAQCAGWLSWRGYEFREVDDGAIAAQELAQSGRRDVGILGPRAISTATGLYCLEGPVQDRADNRTTFRLLTRRGLFEPRA